METSKEFVQGDVKDGEEFVIDSPENACTDLHLLSEIGNNLQESNSLDSDNEGKQVLDLGLYSEQYTGGIVDTVDEYVDRLLNNLKCELENESSQVSNIVETVSVESGDTGVASSEHTLSADVLKNINERPDGFETIEDLSHSCDGLNLSIRLGNPANVNEANSTGLVAESYSDDISIHKAFAEDMTVGATCTDINSLSETLVSKSLQLAQEELSTNSKIDVSMNDIEPEGMEQKPDITAIDSEDGNNATDPFVKTDVIITEPRDSVNEADKNKDENGRTNSNQLSPTETRGLPSEADSKVIPVELNSNRDDLQQSRPSPDNNSVTPEIGRAPVSTVYEEESPVSEPNTETGPILDTRSHSVKEDEESHIITAEYGNDMEDGRQDSDQILSNDLPPQIDAAVHESEIVSESHSGVMLPNLGHTEAQCESSDSNEITSGERNTNYEHEESKRTDKHDHDSSLINQNEVADNKGAESVIAEYDSLGEIGTNDTNHIHGNVNEIKSNERDEVDFFNPRLSVVDKEETSVITEIADVSEDKRAFDEVDFHNPRVVHTIADIKRGLIADSATLGYDELDSACPLPDEVDASVPDSGKESPDVTSDPADSRIDAHIEHNDEYTKEPSSPDQTVNIPEENEQFAQSASEQPLHSPAPSAVDVMNSPPVQIVINPVENLHAQGGIEDLKEQQEIIQSIESDHSGPSGSSHTEDEKDAHVSNTRSGHVHIQSGTKSAASVSRREYDASSSSKYGTNRSMFPLLTSQKQIYSQDDKTGRTTNDVPPRQEYTVHGHSGQNEWKPNRRQGRAGRDIRSQRKITEKNNQVSRTETNELSMSESVGNDPLRSEFRHQRYKPNGSQTDSHQGQSRLLPGRMLSYTASPRLMPARSARSTSATGSVWMLSPRAHYRPLTTRTTASSKDGRDKQKEFFRVELKRLKNGLDKEKSKIKKPPIQSHIPYVFNTLEPYYNVDTAKYLIELPEEASHGYISRRTAIGLCDPWDNLAMDKNEVNRHSPRSGMTSNVGTPRKSKSYSDRPPVEGSTRLPKFPVVALETDFSNKELCYNDVPILRRELREKYSANAHAKIESDYRRTTQDFYRMGLDKMDELHPLSRPHMRNSYFAYLQNTPGSRKAVHECVRKAETGIN